MSKILIMPTVRAIRPEFIAEWADKVDTILVIDDSDHGYVFDHPKAVNFSHYTQQRAYVDEKLWPWVPHHSKSCVQFGSYYAYREGYDIALFLDDDCRVYGPTGGKGSPIDFTGSTVELPAWVPTKMPWHDPIPYPGVYARGFPYEFRSKAKPAGTWELASGKLQAVMSLWDDVLDINCIDKIAGVDYRKFLRGFLNCPNYRPEMEPLYVTSAYFPFSGMAMAITRDALPAYIWAPAKELLSPVQRINRHEDIWAGFILEHIARGRGDLIGICGPQVVHEKEGYSILNAVEEMFEIVMAPYIYRLLNYLVVDPAHGYIESTARFGEMLTNLSSLPDGAFYDYLQYYGRYIQEWMNNFQGS